MGYMDIILEIDNHEAFKTMRDYNIGAPAAVYDIADQIDNLARNHRWICVIPYVYPVKNKVAIYVARLGMETRDRLYTLDMPVGGVEELLDWDLGMRINHSDLVDVVLSDTTPDPVDFDGGLTLADQVQELGLGHVQMMGPLANVMRMNESFGEGQEIQEDSFITSSRTNDGALFADDPPLEDID